jgi:hypothetical protein
VDLVAAGADAAVLPGGTEPRIQHPGGLGLHAGVDPGLGDLARRGARLDRQFDARRARESGWPATTRRLAARATAASTIKAAAMPAPEIPCPPAAWALMIMAHDTDPASTALPDGALRLSDWGLIRATGRRCPQLPARPADPGRAAPGPGQARLAGYCSAKGRLMASFVVWPGADDEVLLACSADLLPATLKRLSMFVLRAKCKLSDASGRLALWGAVGGPRLACWATGPACALAGACRRARRSDPPARCALVDGHRGALPDRRAAPPAPAGLPALDADGLAGAGSTQRRAAHRGGHRRAVRAADGQPGTGGRRQLPEGLLPGPGGGGAQPVPRHAQAPGLCRADGRAPWRPARRSSTAPTPISRRAMVVLAGSLAGRALRCTGRAEDRGHRRRQPAPGCGADGPRCSWRTLPYHLAVPPETGLKLLTADQRPASMRSWRSQRAAIAGRASPAPAWCRLRGSSRTSAPSPSRRWRSPGCRWARRPAAPPA